MTAASFLNVLGLSLGFVAALFFAFGAATVSAKNIYSVVLQRHTINSHWYTAVSDQRAEYIVGAVLLLVSFVLQFAGMFAPADAKQPLFSSLASALTVCALALAALSVAGVLIRRAISRQCVREIESFWSDELAKMNGTS